MSDSDRCSLLVCSSSSLSWLLLSLYLLVDTSDEGFKFAVHLSDHLHTPARVDGLFMLGGLVSLGNARGCHWDISLADSLNVLLSLVKDRLFVILALPRHFGKVSLSSVLLLSAAHLGLHAADNSLLAGVVSSIPSFLNAVLDLDSRQ